MNTWLSISSSAYTVAMDGMRQRRGGPRLLPQARSHPLVAEQVRRQRLQRDRAMQPRVVGQVDDAHAAAAEDAHDPVGADLRARFEMRRRLEEALVVVVRGEQRHDLVLDVGRLG